MEIECESFRSGAGNVASTGVATSHAFRQVGSEPFCWLEMQTPRFPQATARSIVSIGQICVRGERDSDTRQALDSRRSFRFHFH